MEQPPSHTTIFTPNSLALNYLNSIHYNILLYKRINFTPYITHNSPVNALEDEVDNGMKGLKYK